MRNIPDFHEFPLADPFGVAIAKSEILAILAMIINNWPDSPTDNHGKYGQNFTFCDGHAEWVSQRKFMEVWNVSHDSSRVAGVSP